MAARGLPVPEREDRRRAGSRAHRPAARQNARAEGLPGAAALLHPGVGLRVDLEIAPVEAEDVEEAGDDKGPVRDVAHDGAPEAHVRDARLVGRLDAQAARLMRQARASCRDFAVHAAEVAEDRPHVAGVYRGIQRSSHERILPQIGPVLVS